MSKLVDYFSYFSSMIAAIVLFIVVININPNLLQRALGSLVPPSLVINYETLLIWRERVLDTLFQVIALAAALLGVLAFTLRGEKKHA